MLRRPLLLIALAAPIAAACHHDAPAPVAPSNKTETTSANATADDVLGFLPGDAEIVGGIDAVALRNSAVWKQYEPQITAGLGQKYDHFVSECGFDPMKQTERVTFGGKVVGDGKFEGVFVLRGVAGSHILDCLTKEMQDKAAVTNAGGVVTVTDREDGTKISATIVANNTMVGVVTTAQGTLKLETVLASGTPLRGSAAFMELFNRREANAGVWGMVNGNSPVLAQAAQAGARPKSIDGTLVLTDKFDGTARATFATADEAAGMQKQLDQVAQMAKNQVTTADVIANGPVVSLHVVATSEQLKTIMGMLGAFM